MRQKARVNIFISLKFDQNNNSASTKANGTRFILQMMTFDRLKVQKHTL